jgi:hypothetical protein
MRLHYSIESENIDFISAFVRNIGGTLGDTDSIANEFASELHSIIIARLDKGEYIGGIWKSKPYSENPIKAYKLGWAVVSGEGMQKSLTIDGVQIDRDDWVWGDYDKEKAGVDFSTLSGYNFRDSHHKPLPVFLPGYLGWRQDYNGLGNVVDLQFTNEMVDGFSVDVSRSRGSNQFGGRYEFDFFAYDKTEEAEYTDEFREWMSVTDEELERAMEILDKDLITSLFVRRRRYR